MIKRTDTGRYTQQTAFYVNCKERLHRKVKGDGQVHGQQIKEMIDKYRKKYGKTIEEGQDKLI